MLLIGLDIGTTGCKACVFDESGRLRGQALRECAVISTRPAMAEQDAEAVWLAVKDVLRESAAQSGRADEIAGLSISSQGDAIIPIDRSYNALHPAILGMDYRCEAQALELSEKFGSRALFNRTGMRPHPMNSAVKILWLGRYQPGAFNAAWKITTYADFIAGKLCGEAMIDYTMASRTMCFDTGEKKWAADILDALGMDESKLSAPAASGRIIATIRRDVAGQTGLPAAVKVVTGGHDQCCSALGAGVIGNNRAVLSCGTAEVLSTAFSSADFADALYENYYPCYLSAVEGLSFTFSLLHVGGIILQWYRDNIATAEVLEAAKNGTSPYTEIDKAMPDGISPVMILPHFNGSGTPYCDMKSKGAILGLSLSTTRHDIARAILESLAFEQRINLDKMEEGGVVVDELAAVGGGARSPRGLQLRADILGRPLMTLAVREAACLAAALLAGTALGVYSTIREAVQTTVRPDKMYSPDPVKEKAYKERFAIYSTLYKALKPVAERL
jgi:xylulokinase